MSSALFIPNGKDEEEGETEPTYHSGPADTWPTDPLSIDK